MPKIVILHWNKEETPEQAKTYRERLQEKWEQLLHKPPKEPPSDGE